MSSKIGRPAKKIVRAVLFLLIFALLFFAVQRLIQAKWLDKDHLPTMAWDEYRSLEKDTVDVLYLGTSQVYSAVDPLYIYDQTGITGYVISVGGMRWDLACASLRTALQTQSPKVVFADMSMIRYGSSKDEASIHTMLDQLPLSFAKIRYVLECDNRDLTLTDALFPLLRYHSRWDSLKEEDFAYAAGDVEISNARGHLVSYKIVGADHWKFYDDTESVYTIPARAWKYMQEFAAICEDNGIELVLFKVPAMSWKVKWSAASELAAEELGVPFWEMFYEIDEMGVDSTVDFRDNVKHMNQYGANKVSARIGEYLTEQFDLSDQRGSNARWDEDLENYHEALGYRQ